ncbi:MAG: SH3 domain-containing protein [Aristaeellaceae bacterium]
MKRLMPALLLLLLLLPLSALAGPEGLCDPVPASLTARIRSDTWQDAVQDCIVLTTGDGAEHAFIVTGDGWGLYGYRLEDGAWVSVMSGSALTDCTDVYFRRHGSGALRPDGACWPDDCGFDLYSVSTGRCLSYRYDGEFFALAAWSDPAAWDGGAVLDGDTLRYYAAGQSGPVASIPLDEGLRSWFVSADSLPCTPGEAEQLAAISESAVADRHPGYTLASYTGFNGGREAEAAWMKVEDGALCVRREQLIAGDDADRGVDCMPVPLSAELLARLETEGPDTLLDVSGYGSLFLTEAGPDTSVIPVAGRVLASDLQTHALILLTEDDAGVRRLSVVTLTWSSDYEAETSRPLPEGTDMDIFHAGDGCILLSWEDQRRQAGYQQRSDGSWQLTWVMHAPDGEEALNCSVAFCGVRTAWSAGGTDGMMIGTPAGLDLMQADLTALPGTEAELAASIDRTGWAVVSNPDPADRLHLRTEPDRSAASLGKFWNGTPVRVLEERDGWCRVEIGTDGNLTGWMMKKYLTFGEAMDSVACAFPQVFVKEEYEGWPIFRTAAQDENMLTEVNGEVWAAGVVEDDLYVILTDLGETGYADQARFTPGNG